MMEQETGYAPVSPRKVRRQLLFSTPPKKHRIHDTRSDEIQRTPKCKLSKSKVIEKISKNKFVIDFNIEKNYFLDEIDTTAYFRGEEYDPVEARYNMLIFGTETPTWQFASPQKTIRKPRITSANINDFTSVTKESRTSKSFEESPFCKLLDESDRFSVDKYQTLSAGSELDQTYEGVREKYSSQVQLLETFFQYFEQRSSGIMDIFTQDSVFEILGENKIHSLSVTLNALAKVFLKFECEAGSIEFDYKFAAGDDENEIIVSTTGKLYSMGFKPDFIMSTKVLLNENLIKHIKLKLC